MYTWYIKSVSLLKSEHKYINHFAKKNSGLENKYFYYDEYVGGQILQSYNNPKC